MKRVSFRGLRCGVCDADCLVGRALAYSGAVAMEPDPVFHSMYVSLRFTKIALAHGQCFQLLGFGARNDSSLRTV